MSQKTQTSSPEHQQLDSIMSIDAEQQRPSPPRNQPKEDQALQLLEDVGHTTTLSPESNARVLRKIDLRLLPILLGIYFLQQLDNPSLAYASVFGIIEKAHLHGQQYSWLGSVVYLAQLVAQPVVAYFLAKLPLGKFLAVSSVLCGIVLSCMTAAKTFVGLLICRMFLGMFEAMIGEFRWRQSRKMCN